MTEVERAEITDERLRYYRARMQQSGGTPLFCVGITPEGQAVVCLPEGVPLETVAKLMRQATELVERAL